MAGSKAWQASSSSFPARPEAATKYPNFVVSHAFSHVLLSKGTWVRLLQSPVERRMVSGFQGLDVGHRLRVQLTRTDVERGYIDFKKVGSG